MNERLKHIGLQIMDSGSYQLLMGNSETFPLDWYFFGEVAHESTQPIQEINTYQNLVDLERFATFLIESFVPEDLMETTSLDTEVEAPYDFEDNLDFVRKIASSPVKRLNQSSPINLSNSRKTTEQSPQDSYRVGEQLENYREKLEDISSSDLKSSKVSNSGQLKSTGLQKNLEVNLHKEEQEASTKIDIEEGSIPYNSEIPRIESKSFPSNLPNISGFIPNTESEKSTSNKVIETKENFVDYWQESTINHQKPDINRSNRVPSSKGLPAERLKEVESSEHNRFSELPTNNIKTVPPTYRSFKSLAALAEDITNESGGEIATQKLLGNSNPSNIDAHLKANDGKTLTLKNTTQENNRQPLDYLEPSDELKAMVQRQEKEISKGEEIEKHRDGANDQINSNNIQLFNKEATHRKSAKPNSTVEINSVESGKNIFPALNPSKLENQLLSARNAHSQNEVSETEHPWEEDSIEIDVDEIIDSLIQHLNEEYKRFYGPI